jgi:hypothetical protein
MRDPFRVNKALKSRIDSVFDSLMTSFRAGSELSSATKGIERELFVSAFLSQIFPPHYRFSSGDVTSHDDARSGQIDIVMEFPRGFSLPFHPSGPRLFFAEGVAAAIEVKSNLSSQWDEVLATGKKLRNVKRRFDPDYYDAMAVELETGKLPYTNGSPHELAASLRAKGRGITNRAGTKIPLFAVGFTGWKTRETIEEKLSCGVVDAIFIVESQLFCSTIGPGFGSGSYSMLMFLEVELLRTNLPMPVSDNYRC